MNKPEKINKKVSGKVPLYQIQAFCITCETKHKIWTTLQENLKIDVCSQCHPFYLGKQKFESKAGRMERFRQIAEKSAALKKPKAPSPAVSSKSQ